MSKNTTDELEQILDDHAEFYIRQTMKFFQNEGESPALSKENEGDRQAKARLEALIASKVEEARKEWQKRSENSPYTKSWIAKQLGISRPYLNKLLKDPEQFTIGMVKKLEALQSREQDKV